MEVSNTLNLEQYDDLDTFHGLEAVRRLPGMYVGSTTSQNGDMPRGLLQLVQEILSNSADEALLGFGKEIEVVLCSDGSLSVRDEGRGLPYGDEGDSAIRGATVLHSSAKIERQVYQKSGGMHGIGLKATNALSRWLKLEAVTSVGDAYSFHFEQDTIVDRTHRLREDAEPTYTKVTFLPDDRIFDNIEWQFDVLDACLKNMAYQTPGVTYILKDTRLDELVSVSYCFEGGMTDYVQSLYLDDWVGFNEPIHLKASYEVAEGSVVGEVSESIVSDALTLDVELAFGFGDTQGECVRSFVNGIPTTEGGPHEQGLRRGVSDVLLDFVSQRQLLKKGQSLDARDCRDGLVAALSVRIPGSILQFESQTKEKLATSVAESVVYQFLLDYFDPFLYSNLDSSEQLVEKLLESYQARLAAQEIRKIASNSRKKRGSKARLLLSSKLSSASSKDPKLRELFIVEGDSAGGTAKKARDGRFQAILPLRGKPENILGTKLSKVLKNEEMSTLIHTLGCGVLDEFDLEQLQYHKIILMADADDDGSHIVALLIGAIWRLMPGLIKQGHVYLANAPLFRFDTYIKGKRQLVFALDQAEYDKLYPTHQDWRVTRLKGLGEMNDRDLKLTTMDPKTRRLTQLTVEDAKVLDATIDLFLGNTKREGKTAPARRREYLEQHALFVYDD